MPRKAAKPHVIVCRAKVAQGCLDGEPTSKQFFGQDLPMSEDGTYLWGPVEMDDGQSMVMGSLVCDACYLYLMPRTPSGKALNHELPAAIKAVRAAQAADRERERQERS